MAIRALDAKKLDDWKCHVANEHIPARRDCAQCLRTMGRDGPHVRTKVPSAFCLNLDVASPFNQEQDRCLGTGPRCFVVGVCAVPMQQGPRDIRMPLKQSWGEMEFHNHEGCPTPAKTEFDNQKECSIAGAWRPSATQRTRGRSSLSAGIDLGISEVVIKELP